MDLNKTEKKYRSITWEDSIHFSIWKSILQPKTFSQFWRVKNTKGFCFYRLELQTHGLRRQKRERLLRSSCKRSLTAFSCYRTDTASVTSLRSTQLLFFFSQRGTSSPGRPVQTHADPRQWQLWRWRWRDRWHWMGSRHWTLEFPDEVLKLDSTDY